MAREEAPDNMASEPLVRPEDTSILSAGSTLQDLFEEVIQRNFAECVHLSDRDVLEYVADLLIRFSRTEALYRIRNVRGKALEDVGEMLIASNPLLEAASFDTEREVRKHIGDFTLFFAGLFPEAVNQWRLRRARLDALLDYIETGKESYYIVSGFNQFEHQATAPLFKKMSEEFERCVFGLHLVKRDFERMQQDSYTRARDLLT